LGQEIIENRQAPAGAIEMEAVGWADTGKREK